MTSRRIVLGLFDRLEAEVKAAIARIPPARRRIITTHDAFGYFARAYGIAFVTPQGVSTEAKPPPRALRGSSGRSGRRRSRPSSWRTFRIPG